MKYNDIVLTQTKIQGVRKILERRKRQNKNNIKWKLTTIESQNKIQKIKEQKCIEENNKKQCKKKN